VSVVDVENRESSEVSDPNLAAFLELVDGRCGHFLLESGHHGALWLDLDPLFADQRRIEPLVDVLTNALRPYEVTGVCGPLLGGAFLAQLVAQKLGVKFSFTERVTLQSAGMYQARYRLPPAFATRVRRQRLAMVDDVMSAGSALRGTYEELKEHGATPVVAGALLVLGSTGAGFFTQRGVAVGAAARDDYELWLPADCPLCASDLPLEDVAITSVAQTSFPDSQ
jgi:orotate phosphoribosyltransferase